ncbi:MULTISPECIES: PepSY domain-containing protein [Achromobacter]|jgi:Peptidase propeptide and YPEB domain|uniref:PepSY domain-containing protein n=1 Tax=Achromobacter sp. HNDS-1 TaxID=3151598 RepID=A0AAU7LFF1_9BURK|nr:PepSY domain-containing protein [Achromobacter ruhlandii]MCI1839588.1 PepSY domain-containing protein [Achromobacter ruhlandii]
MNPIRKTLTALAIGAATLTGAAALAQTAPQPAPAAPAPAATAQAAPAAQILTVRQIYDVLTAAGYRNITEIELEHHRGYDVKADNPQGQRVKLRVDAQTGAVLRSRIKD